MPENFNFSVAVTIRFSVHLNFGKQAMPKNCNFSVAITIRFAVHLKFGEQSLKIDPAFASKPL